jgi:hypothetical protein
MAYVLLKARPLLLTEGKVTMNSTIRMKAVSYAAKVAIGAAFVAACGGSKSEEETSTPTAQDIVKGKSAPDCKAAFARLQAMFPDGDDDWYKHLSDPDPRLAGDTEVTACCETSLKADEADASDFGVAARENFRNIGCCAADYSGEATPTKIGACSPWGPPVPPSMKWVA